MWAFTKSNLDYGCHFDFILYFYFFVQIYSPEDEIALRRDFHKIPYSKLPNLYMCAFDEFWEYTVNVLVVGPLKWLSKNCELKFKPTLFFYQSSRCMRLFFSRGYMILDDRFWDNMPGWLMNLKLLIHFQPGW